MNYSFFKCGFSLETISEIKLTKDVRPLSISSSFFSLLAQNFGHVIRHAN